MPQFFYAVRKGRNPGIYNTWPECQQQVERFTGCAYKKFSTLREAQDFISIGSAIKKKHERDYEEAPEFQGRTGLGSYPEADDEEQEPPAKKIRPLTESIINNNSSSASSSSANNEDWLVVYTDGSTLNNGQAGARGGIGVFFGPNDPRNLSEPLPSIISQPSSSLAATSSSELSGQTNQRAEITAAIRALEVIFRSSSNGAVNRNRNIEIRTDSKYVIKSITEWIHAWRLNGWRTASNQPVANRDLLMRLYNLCYQNATSLNTPKMNIKWTHVRGHQGHYGNEQADRLARMGASRSGN